jgi:hypothetical protein
MSGSDPVLAARLKSNREQARSHSGSAVNTDIAFTQPHVGASLLAMT